MIFTSANSHLGDSLWAAIALRRIGGQHTFHVPYPYLAEIMECLEGTNIRVRDIQEAPADALSTWIACGRYERSGVLWRNQTDIIDFLMQWANAMARECGVSETLFKYRQDMLCDFPAIQRDVEAPEFDVLVVNAAPLSGQAPGWDNGEMDVLIGWLARKHRVLCTNPTTAKDVPVFRGSIAAIGNLSTRAKAIVAVSTGASACVNNAWNSEIPKWIFLSPQFLNYGRSDIIHCENVEAAVKSLKTEGWL